METARMKDATRQAAENSKIALIRIDEQTEIIKRLRTEIKQLKEMLQRRVPTKKSNK
jgi:hypothetical protein